MMKPVRLKDVAAAAGVSVSTASRLLDDRQPPSHSETAERVRAVAEKLGYRRDVVASSMRRKGPSTVGVLVPRISDTVSAVFFEAIYAEAQRRGIFALVSVCGDDEEVVKKAADTLLTRRVDGLVITAARTDDPIAQYLRSTNVDHVLAIRTDGESPSVGCDDELGGYLATRHLIDLGHTHIAVCPGPKFASTACRRLTGFRRAMEEAGLEIREDWILHSLFDFEAGVANATALLGADRPTAVFAANDAMALGVMAQARTMGLKVPLDLSVVGYNDTPLAEQMPKPLTTVRVPFEQIASAALDQLFGPASDELRREFVPTLIPRKTTARPQ
ncbi:LacI family DNA-binding transcriptional regulator [Corynebacterium sp. H130]|uniref:LacI family DNA-binding transcriptional regulator n=1 Tax=Corynebacterium sp. H130 TaxID=3133444 RepID=UPI0030ADE86A